MKWLDNLRLKKIFLLLNGNDRLINYFNVDLKKDNIGNFVDSGKNSLSNVLRIYEIRLERYQEEDTGMIHIGFQESMIELRKFDEEFVKIWSFQNKEINYTIFTDLTVKKLIGCIQHIKKTYP